MQELREKAIKSFFWLGSARFLGQVFAWVFTIVLVRILTPEDFGIMGIAMAYHTVVAILYDINLSAAIVQKKDLSKEEESTCFWFILMISALFYIVTWYFAPIVSHFFSNEQITKILRVLNIAILFDAFHLVPFWLLSKELDFEKRAKAEFFSNILQSITAVGLALLGFGVWSLVYSTVLKFFVRAILIYAQYSWRPQFTFRPSVLRQMLRFSIPLTGYQLLRHGALQGDTVIIGRILGERILGFYRVAMDLSKIVVDKLIVIVNHVSFPVYSQLQDETDMLKSYFLKVNQYIALIAFPVLIGIAIIAEEIIVLILSEKWLPVRIPLQILSIVSLFHIIGTHFPVILNARGKSNINLYFSILSIVTLLPALYFAADFGLIGISLMWLFVYPLLTLFIIFKTLKEIELRLSDYIRSIRHPVLGTITMSLAVMAEKIFIFGNSITYISLFILIGTGFVAYVGYFYLFSPDTFSDVKNLISTLLNKKTKSVVTGAC
jgi:O-antigen/teichoic acid export membrane protein